ncbi:hypothetical protein [Microbacterium sp.]|uniref:hypothetical protein n=1 Tax=Microbacterium sp. TaxID=51671 RepID=UPI0039E47ED7
MRPKIVAGICVSVLLAALTGCAQQVAVSGAATDSALPTTCTGQGLEFARQYGEGARALTGSTASAAEIADWEAKRLGATAPAVTEADEGLYTLCYYDGVTVAAPHPPADDSSSEQEEYTVLCVIIDPKGEASFSSAATADSADPHDFPEAT